MGRLPVALPKECRHPAGLVCSPLPGGCVSRSFFLLTFAEPPLLRFTLDAALFAFQLRGELYVLFALPRKRRACDTSPSFNHVLAFQSLSPDAEVDATPVGFLLAKVLIKSDIPITFTHFFQKKTQRRPYGRHREPLAAALLRLQRCCALRANQSLGRAPIVANHIGRGVGRKPRARRTVRKVRITEKTESDSYTLSE